MLSPRRENKKGSWLDMTCRDLDVVMIRRQTWRDTTTRYYRMAVATPGVCPMLAPVLLWSSHGPRGAHLVPKRGVGVGEAFPDPSECEVS